MLLIPDIHINARHADSIIAAVREFVDAHPAEDSIVFLGDYVYHFAYDRKSLLQLFRFFVELYQEGKRLYILAGNHDWIAGEFVFSEGKMASDLLNLGQQDGGCLHFVTDVELVRIEGQDVLFVPYNISLTSDEVDCVDQQLEAIRQSSSELAASRHKGEQFSGRVNALLATTIDNYQQQGHDDMLVVHHYYVEGVQFPGQRGRFGFKDVALDRRFCGIGGIKMLSGHIHQPFVHANYCCLGSLWATSPLEINQTKVAGVYRDGVLSLTTMKINGYLRVDADDESLPLTATVLMERQRAWGLALRDTMGVGDVDALWKVELLDDGVVPLTQLAIQIVVERVDYTQMDSYMDGEVQQQLTDIQLKKQGTSLSGIQEKLSLADKDLRQGFADWKEILKTYITQKYGDEQDDYLDILRELELL